MKRLHLCVYIVNIKIIYNLLIKNISSTSQEFEAGFGTSSNTFTNIVSTYVQLNAFVIHMHSYKSE